ncbi:MAG: Holliday junction branch migration protein RuvA [Planctomycetota bacterium]|jgi:holliday junction DNA helicase RuvA|nr:helix-hairpin-helix domain-containing protein [Planctomycetia bacterium]MDO7679131.1 helix-hairpin-helix domain-containing protein [Pirellulales bacterium]RLS32939.1 MAG: Holliday junction DNA helicase RuvA [Planctomycetota bacterium]RLS59840.1 MAG: Holliday junction DNA helicase RuvA [Planctomycetota bacterium]TSA09542.1 MAG: Holliday junction DNA helicase RuvA [Planctomycetaceae bacterium]
MIKRVQGELLAVDIMFIELGVGPVVHEVLVPELVRRELQGRVGQTVTLHTLEFLEGTPGRGNLVPRMVGFSSEVEREFFDLICEVDGVGVRKALRAMVRAVGEIATAIEEQDTKLLSTLPGIGPATAERMVAKLRRRMPKFALLVARELPGAMSTAGDALSETIDVLRTLGHSDTDARRLVDSLREGKKKYRDVQEALEAIYRQTHPPR